MPPPHVVDSLLVPIMAPAPELAEWVRAMIIEEGGRLHNPEHRHLMDAAIGFMWASHGYTKAGKRVLGLTEDLELSGRGNAWQRMRAEQQMREWFGEPPRFLITLDAFYCSEAGDAEFCALIEHELYHCGQRNDEFGNPAFDKSGRPKLAIRGHDVEEFVGVVRRYGVGDPGSYLADMIRAVAAGPEIAPIRVSQACGTCLLRVAA